MTSQESYVVLVDQGDRPIGVMEKMLAHQKGLLHRAFSVFIFNDQKEMLLQKRALSKYHSPGLWTNACCSHPNPAEANLDAAKRRLNEELGFTCELSEIGSFTYKSDFDNGLTEHEYDHVFFGSYSGPILPNIDEVTDYRWISIPELEDELISFEDTFTTWFHLAYPLIKEWISNPTLTVAHRGKSQS